VSESTEVREAVRQHYALAALRVLQPTDVADAAACRGSTTTRVESTQASCCGGSCGCGSNANPVTGNLYAQSDVAVLPSGAVAASLGCGNPTALIDLRPGEVVLDLGSGGGIDVLLSARRVGPTGKAYGLDMTDEMLALARRNVAEAGVRNVEFLKGQIEEIPLPDSSVDVVISNCVINLSTDKRRVLREAFRVLKPGGRFAVSDVVVDGPVPSELRRQVELWVGCIAGAMDRSDYQEGLRDAGFDDVSIEPTRFYAAEDLGDPQLESWLHDQPPSERERLSHAFLSAFVRARRPGSS
jgi:arsenite methyltransferase